MAVMLLISSKANLKRAIALSVFGARQPLLLRSVKSGYNHSTLALGVKRVSPFI